MANLDTINVFIDTEFFDASNLDFEATSFKELIRLTQAKRAKVFLTTVTESEILAHIDERIHQAFLALEKFRSKGYILKNVTALQPVFTKLDEQEAAAEVRYKFKTFLAEANVMILGLDNVDSGAVFQDYFDKKHPFGTDKKKYEFPDAFAQQALEKWCETNKDKMYVVSADPDWQGLEDKSRNLIPIVKLQEFINLAVKDESEDLSNKVMRLYQLNSRKVETSIKEAFEACGFYTDDVDGDVDDVTITRLELGDPQILEVEEGSATVSVSVDLDYYADVSYDDDNAGIWDSEDHKWFYRPTKYAEVQESENFDAELFIQFNPDNDKSFDVSCTIGASDFRVTVLPTDYELK